MQLLIKGRKRQQLRDVIDVALKSVAMRLRQPALS